jgi:precorrin-3B methylase
MSLSQSENISIQPGIRFDTHRVIKHLTSAGIAPAAAEIFVDTMQKIVVASYEDLATKQEIQRLESTTKQEIQRLESTTKQEIQRVEHALKHYVNKAVLAVIVGAPTFYAGLQFLITFFSK